MGTLVVTAYPTSLFANAADHTYVMCGNGAVRWSCWGGSTGGTALRSAVGSTSRAGAIAEPNQQAGITCYLINGVCHQAANRVLLPAQITVIGARGYNLSQALFGVYGRVRWWPCRAPFNRQPGVTGDLPACAGPAQPAGQGGRSPADQIDANYAAQALELFERAEAQLPLDDTDGLSEAVILESQIAQYAHMVNFYLGPIVTADQLGQLLAVREQTERERLQLERNWGLDARAWPEFRSQFNALTLRFQRANAEILADEQYERLFELKRGEEIVLADPDIEPDFGLSLS